MAESYPKGLKKNTVGRGEIACFKQFLLFQQCFQKTCPEDMKKQGFVWERVNIIHFCL